MGDVDIEKILVFNKISLGEKTYKYFISYLYSGIKVKPLKIMLHKASAYAKSYDGVLNGCIFWLKMMDDLLEIYNTIWDKVSADIKKEFHSEPVYKKNHLKKKKKNLIAMKSQILTIKKLLSCTLIILV